MVSGGPYGLEELIQSAGYLAALLVLINAGLWLTYSVRVGWHADRTRSHAYAVATCARHLTGARQSP